MAADGEMPALFAHLSSKGTPLYGIVICVFWTFLVGSVGAVGGVMTLTAVTLASNVGTFFLYGAVCVTTVVKFRNLDDGTEKESILKHVVIPIIGLFLNALMIGSIFGIGLSSGGDTTLATVIALVLASAWACISIPYWKM